MRAYNPVDLSLAQCPGCAGALEIASVSSINCTNCEHHFPIVEGIPTLLLDLERDTALDFETYKLHHPADPVKIRAGVEPYVQMLGRAGIESGVCLEIGSGTGVITAGLVRHANFSQIHCSDISLRFLRHIKETIGDNQSLHFWRFDASRLPFRDESMDAIVGHSVLHHLLYYEDALRDAKRVLKPGGIIMLGEPVMDSHAMTSLCAGLIAAIETRYKAAALTGHELDLLRHFSRHAVQVGQQMRGRREDLLEIEDKHMYVVQDMDRLSDRLGFRKFEYANAYIAPEIGADHQFRLTEVATKYGVSEEKLRHYDYIFREVSEAYGAALGDDAPYNFGYFVFRK
jgi:ubiquinone/menaquinone biosynthesis C-methylase UbiE/uncharacterized protein YbaR (Trm112 family)